MIKINLEALTIPKIWLLAVLLLFTTALFSVNITGKVISVQDGDTIEILNNKQTYRIRLNGIDCPEKKQDFGNRSKQFTSDQCFGLIVTAIVTDQDRYGRYIADIILPNGKVLNEELVKAGLAWHYKQYSKSNRLATLERDARENKRGLWSLINPIPPWEFRKGSTSKSSSLPSGFYYASKNSDKYHRPSCQWAKKISESNLIVYKTKKDAEKAGYQACKSCKP